MSKRIKNSRAVVLYLPGNVEQFKMFRMFLNSVEMINAVDTDVLVFYQPRYESILNHYQGMKLGSNDAELRLIPLERPSSFDPALKGYHYVDSLACIIGQDWLYEYEYILRTDTDTLLTPKWNTAYPHKFTTGKGAYNTCDEIKDKLNIVSQRNRLFQGPFYQYNPGSTWYGKSKEVIEAATLTVAVTRDLLLNEFKNNEGTWPGFYRGVALLYASELSINHLIPDFIIDADNFDFHSTSANPITNHTHIHCWHTDNDKVFSKHAFFAGAYEHTSIEDLDTNIIRDYCLYCAIA